MIGQYLSNKNKNATVPKTKKISKLNKVLFLKKKREEMTTEHLSLFHLFYILS